ncbi:MULTISPECIES: hypothetical protein [Sphingomonas]|uniref:hypothetical protein n=1 Tax=Sphingomonas TaxID=13687 RepID=UPI00126A4D67|nr:MULTISPECIES: hypothetical protein [Sphingomonas]
MERLNRDISANTDISLSSLKAYLENSGYKRREQWGSFLERFSRKRAGREDNVLLPTQSELVDYEKRVSDLVDALSRQLKLPTPLLLKQIANAGYEVVRIIANEGETQSTLAYDAAIDLLRGGYALIDSSAVVAISSNDLRTIRGRRPDIVRRYLDGVRVGQTEVGSFVMTLLMPVAADGVALDLPPTVADRFGTKVAERMSSALGGTHSAVRSGEMTIAELTAKGITANFSAGLARMVEAVGDVTLSIAPTLRDNKQLRPTLSTFHYDDVKRLRQIEHQLTPPEHQREMSLSGTVINISEPRGKVSGVIVLKSEVFGEERPVRIKYDRSDRSTIMEAMARKSDVYLAVDGSLTSRGGHYRLDEPHDFRIVGRGSLA